MVDDIRARLAACPIPKDAQADWDGTNHYEIHDPIVEWGWLDARDALAAEIACDTPHGKRLGSVLDYACHYRRDLQALLDRIAELEAGLREAQICITKHHDINMKREWGALCPVCAPTYAGQDIHTMIDALLAPAKGKV